MNNEYENMKQDLEADWMVNEPDFHLNQNAAETNSEAPQIKASAVQSAEAGEDWGMNTMVGTGNMSGFLKPDISTPPEVDAPDTNPLGEDNLKEEKQETEWKMPEPVFRVSQGKKVTKSSSPPIYPQASPKPLEEQETSVSIPDIQPQPYISEEFVDPDVALVEEIPVKERSKTTRIILIVLGISAMILFAVGFLIGVYFLFFNQQNP